MIYRLGSNIQARRFFTLKDYLLIQRWLAEAKYPPAETGEVVYSSPLLIVHNAGPAGTVVAYPGDWVVYDSQSGTVQIFKPSVFELTYGKVE